MTRIPGLASGQIKRALWLICAKAGITCGFNWSTRRGTWPNNVDAERIDKSSNMGWEDLKDRMRGSMVVNPPR